MRRVIGRGGYSRRSVGIRLGLNFIVEPSVEQARQHQWSAQLVDQEPSVVLVEDNDVGNGQFVEEATAATSSGICPGLDLVLKYFVEQGRQHQCNTQLVEDDPWVVLVDE